MSFFRWLWPRTPLRGLVFGYLLGYAAWIIFFVISNMINGGYRDAPSELFSDLLAGLLWAIPWGVLWCMSGGLVYGEPRYPATIITLAGLASGTIYSLTDAPLDGWQGITIPVYAVMGFVLWHAAAIPLCLLVWAIMGVEE